MLGQIDVNELTPWSPSTPTQSARCRIPAVQERTVSKPWKKSPLNTHLKN